jgi:hypothetical protein
MAAIKSQIGHPSTTETTLGHVLGYLNHQPLNVKERMKKMLRKQEFIHRAQEIRHYMYIFSLVIFPPGSWVPGQEAKIMGFDFDAIVIGAGFAGGERLSSVRSKNKIPFEGELRHVRKKR